MDLFHSGSMAGGRSASEKQWQALNRATRLFIEPRRSGSTAYARAKEEGPDDGEAFESDAYN